MKIKSFRTEIALQTALIITLVCALCAGMTVFMSAGVANSETRKQLIKIAERNSDEVEYSNGVFSTETDFVFASDLIGCVITDEAGRVLIGECDIEPVISPENNKSARVRYEGNDYFLYCTRLDFNKFEYEIDVESGKVVNYEAEANIVGEVEKADYSDIETDGIVTPEKAVQIAAEHAGLNREDISVIDVSIPEYEDRDVISVEFVSDKSPYKPLYICSFSPVSGTPMLTASGKAALYAMPFVIILAVLMAYFLAGKAVKPINEISAETEKIEEGNDLKERINVHGLLETDRLAASVNNMLSRLESSFESEKRFTSDASHELRTPLAVIKAECEYALSGNADDEEKTEAFESINAQTDKMASLVSSLLSITRAEQGTLKANFEYADFSGLVRQTSENYKTDKKLTVNVQDGIMLNMDTTLMIRVVENLLSNASKYGKENGSIYVSLAKKEKTVLTVEDDGIGIDEKDIGYIFNRFYRADSSRSATEGFGLGLPLVKYIVELHSGTIRAESEPGKGTKMIIEF